MPNRILREGILTSERVNSLDWEQEVFYRRLMSVVDDFGRYYANPALLRAALYPLKLDAVREANIERLTSACEKARLVVSYEVSGKRYLQLLDFKQQKRAESSKYPEPPSECIASAMQPDSGCVADAQQPPASEPYSYAETKAKTKAKAARDGRFDSFWSAYPNKVGKEKARESFAKALKLTDLQTILSAVERQKTWPRWTKDGGTYVPNPATWLNQGRWQDELAKPAYNPVFSEEAINADR